MLVLLHQWSGPILEKASVHYSWDDTSQISHLLQQQEVSWMLVSTG